MKSGTQTQTTTQAPPKMFEQPIQNALTQAGGLQQQGNYIAPINQTAINYGQGVLNGDYLNKNPYLDATFNRAANAVTNQTQSNFAMSGRNPRGVDASAAAQYGPTGAGGGYDDLSAQIYGGAYNNERQIQQNTLSAAPGLGAMTDPARSLDDYIARLNQLQGNYGVSSSQIPYSQNLLGPMIGGLSMFGR